MNQLTPSYPSGTMFFFFFITFTSWLPGSDCLSLLYSCSNHIQFIVIGFWVRTNSLLHMKNNHGFNIVIAETKVWLKRATQNNYPHF